MNATLKWKLVAGFVLAFVAGAAAGAVFTFHQTRHWHGDFSRYRHSLTEGLRTRMQAQLDLTPEQLAKIQPILNRATDELQKIRAETGAKVRQVMTETHRALEPELTETQRARLKNFGQNAPVRHGLRNPSRHRGPRDTPPPDSSPDE